MVELKAAFILTGYDMHAGFVINYVSRLLGFPMMSAAFSSTKRIREEFCCEKKTVKGVTECSWDFRAQNITTDIVDEWL